MSLVRIHSTAEGIKPTSSRFVDLTGKIYWRLKVLFLSASSNRHWVCECKCGAIIPVYGPSLTSDHTKSCGCYSQDLFTEIITSHGKAGTREHRIWKAMKTRCYNPKTIGWKNYGGKGIAVCDRWFHSFQAFLDDMGTAPTNKHSLDRFPDQNGNYEPGNVRWATRKQQNRNSSRNPLITHDGKTLTLPEWSEITGVPRSCLYFRIITAKWPVEKALTTPSQANR